MKSDSIKVFPLLAGLAAVLLTALAAADPAGSRWSAEVEVKVADTDRTGEQALAKARLQAVESCLASRVPPSILDENPEARGRVMAQADRFVVSWETIEEREEAGVLTLRVRVVIDQSRLDAALKAEGLLPVRELPRVFLMVVCQDGGNTIPSAWENPSGIGGEKNPCEPAMAEALESYGLRVIKPEKGQPRIETRRVMNPQNEQEKSEVFRELREKFGAGVMLVGKARLEPGAREGDRLLSLQMVAVDLVSERALVSDHSREEVEIKGPKDRDPALSAFCRQAGLKVVEAVFRTWVQKPAPGEPRKVRVVIQNLESYHQMKEMEDRMRREGPGVTEVSLTRAAAGRFEFTVTTSAEAGELARWLESAPLQEKNLRVIDLKPDLINAIRE